MATTKKVEDIRPGDTLPLVAVVESVHIEPKTVTISYQGGGSDSYPIGSAVPVSDPSS